MEPLFILASLIVFGAFLINAIGGFGSGIIAMSLLLLFLDLRLASVALGLANLLSLLQLVWTMRRQVDMKAVLPLVATSVIGLYLGIKLLLIPDLDFWAKAILTVIIILLSLKELFLPDKRAANRSATVRLGLPAAIGLGLFSGVLGGWISMSGPPLILFAYHTMEGRAARRFLTLVFLLTQLVKLVMFGFEKLYTAQSLVLFAYMAPAVVLGTLLGNAFQKKISQDRFVRVAWSILLALGIVLGANTILSIS
ncbi:MAG: sulfite exporter TauE/SafE family protein [Anaerolineales bacterium]|nr:sulfite exporter TauE/SafE family protein [Anaerolineales bacterium]